MDTVSLDKENQSLNGQSADGKPVSGKRMVAGQPPKLPGTGAVGNPPPTTGTTTTPGAGVGTSGGGGLPDFLSGLNFGLQAALRDGKLVIASVKDNPFAAILKLKEGDRILTIDGKPTDGITEEKARELMRGSAGQPARLEILRQADKSRVSFTMPSAAMFRPPGTTDVARIPTGQTPASREGGTGNDTIEIHVAEGGLIEGGDGDSHAAAADDRAAALRRANRKAAGEHILLAAELAEEGKWPQAETEYREGVRLDPTRDDAWSGLGEACDAQNKWADAAAAYRKAIELFPEDGTNHADLAHALLRQGLREEALKSAKEAIRLGLEDHPVYKELGLK
jgi:hypothetical protein